MRLASRPMLVAALAVACAASKSTLPPDQLVAFGPLDVDAATSIVIRRDGETVGVIHWPDKPQEEHRGVLSKDQLATLHRGLVDRDCCRLDSERVYAYADEPRVTLDVRWGELDCRIELWAQEWDELPAAKACRDLLRTVAAPSPADGDPR